MTEQKAERINKYLAAAGICSRRQADMLVEQGKVLINGQIAKSGMKVSSGDKVELIGGKEQKAKKQIKGSAEKIVLAFYKPVGVMCTEKDKFADKKVLDYVKTKTRVTYAGRLDKESEGLMILTNDGDLIQRMMKGIEKHEKEYVVKVDKELTAEFIEKMGSGVYLKELDRTTRPCPVTMEGKYTFRIILTQGMNRQIRRMCENFGYKVKALKRVRIMNVELGKMKPGESRVLTKTECATLYRLAGMQVPAELLK